MPLATRLKFSSVGILAILVASPILAAPQDEGLWSQPFESEWPVFHRKILLTPQGNILSIGRLGGSGSGDYRLVLDIWNPELGTDEKSHVTLSDSIANISSQTYSPILIPDTSKVFIAGATVQTDTSGSSTGSSIFDTQTNTASSVTSRAATNQQLLQSSTSTTLLPSGEILVGGDNANGIDDLRPEIYSPTTNQWRTLTEAPEGYGVWVVPNGEVLFGISYLDTTGNGSVAPANTRLLASGFGHPVMYRPGSLFWANGNWTNGFPNKSVVTTFNGREIEQREITSPRPYGVEYSNKTTLLPTGDALLFSKISPDGIISQAQNGRLEIWDATTESWSLMASSLITRSTVLTLLKDGRVLVLANNQRSKIFSPPYLFNSEGNLAERPTIISAPAKANHSNEITIEHRTDSNISRVTLVTAGRFFDGKPIDQRFIELDFGDLDNGVSVKLPDSASIAPPGYYIMYLIDDKGVPSEGHMISLTTSETKTSAYPEASADSATVIGSGQITIDALVNDTGIGLILNAPNAWSLKGGNVALVDNKVTYKPKSGFNGQDKIWYTFKDTENRSNSGEITITVSGNGKSNPYPSAAADIVSTTNGDSITIDALANDTGTELVLNAPNAWSLKGGNVALVSNKITYTPKAGFNGQDKIWYTFKDNQDRSNSGVVIIAVKSTTTSFPIANTDYYTTLQNTGKKLNILANDVTSGEKSIDTLYEYTSKGGKTYKTPDGQIDYTPKENFIGEDNFWYVMVDSEGRKNSAKVIINVK